MLGQMSLRVRLMVIGIALSVSIIPLVAFSNLHEISQNKEPSGYINVPEDVPTIAQAIERAFPTDVIKVDAQKGPYTETIIAIRNNLRILSVNGAAEIILQPNDSIGLLILGDNNTMNGFSIAGKIGQWIQFIGDKNVMISNTVTDLNVLLVGKNVDFIDNSLQKLMQMPDDPKFIIDGENMTLALNRFNNYQIISESRKFE